MDEKKRSIVENKPLAATDTSSKAAKHTGDEGKYEEKPDDPSTQLSSNYC
jgi:hypothetical protein